MKYDLLIAGFGTAGSIAAIAAARRGASAVRLPGGRRGAAGGEPDRLGDLPELFHFARVAQYRSEHRIQVIHAIPLFAYGVHRPARRAGL